MGDNKSKIPNRFDILETELRAFDIVWPGCVWDGLEIARKNADRLAGTVDCLLKQIEKYKDTDHAMEMVHSAACKYSART